MRQTQAVDAHVAVSFHRDLSAHTELHNNAAGSDACRNSMHACLVLFCGTYVTSACISSCCSQQLLHNTHLVEL